MMHDLWTRVRLWWKRCAQARHDKLAFDIGHARCESCGRPHGFNPSCAACLEEGRRMMSSITWGPEGMATADAFALLARGGYALYYRPGPEQARRWEERCPHCGRFLMKRTVDPAGCVTYTCWPCAAPGPIAR